MPDITHGNIEAALLDQSMAGKFRGRTYCYIAVLNQEARGNHDAWQLGIAVANEPGYNPITKTFDNEKEAREWAQGLNEHIGLADETTVRIVVSTMGGQRYTKKVA